MGNVIMNVYKGQRMDITAHMRDADMILESFRKNNIRFVKKYTTLNGKGPSTITFKGLKADNYHSDLTRMIVDLDKLAQDGEIGNVYVKLTSFVKQGPDAPKEEAKKDDIPVVAETAPAVQKEAAEESPDISTSIDTNNAADEPSQEETAESEIEVSEDEVTRLLRELDMEAGDTDGDDVSTL